MVHLPVLLAETLAGLELQAGMTVVDCTLGGGGHAAAIAAAVGPSGRVIALDQDPLVRAYAGSILKRCPNITLLQTNFSGLSKTLAAQGITAVQGVLFDLGVSSFQLDDPQRGFSWQQDCALDMRMDPSSALTAAALLAAYSETALAELIYRYGEERYSRRIARRICAVRQKNKIQTSGQLKDIIVRSVGGSYAAGTASIARVFQALRIAVNKELEVLPPALLDAAALLAPGGRLAVISFHSLEDRIVKNTLRDLQRQGSFRILSKKPLTADAAELKNNPRARSAKLRIGVRHAG